MQSSFYRSFFCIAVFFHTIYFCNPLAAQEAADSVVKDSAFFSVFPEHYMLQDSLSKSDPLEFELFQRYQPLDGDFPYFRTGNAGHAMYGSMLSSRLQPSSLSSSVIQPVFSYFDDRENMNYYRNKPPFTSLFYYSGAKKEESIDVVHARNFGDNLNFSLHMNRNGSIGFYNHMRARTSIFSTNFNYITKNHRYNAYTHYYYNNKQLEENGGFGNFNNVENPETIGSTRMSNASNDFQEEGVLFSQSFGFGNTARDGEEIVRPIFRIGHDFQYIGGRRKYLDYGSDTGLNTGFYNNIYFDSTFTRDTTEYNRMSNQANLFFYPGENVLKFYYRNDAIQYHQNGMLDTSYQDHAGGSQFTLRFFDKYRSDWNVEYVFAGLRKGDMSGVVNLKKEYEDTLGKPVVTANIYYNLFNPQFKQLSYVSNNFIWHNEFNKTNHWTVNLGLAWKDLLLSGDYGSLTNYIYYNQRALPEQYNNSIQHFSVNASKSLHWRSFNLSNKLTYQHSSNKDILPVPEFMVFESLYFQNYLFKKVVKFQAGFDIYYFTGFNGLAYMPATAEFHIQNKQVIGNYPFIDIFFSFKLKRAFFFLKMEHVNKGMTGENFYLVPDYPTPPRAFKWGLKWNLFD